MPIPDAAINDLCTVMSAYLNPANRYVSTDRDHVAAAVVDAIAATTFPPLDTVKELVAPVCWETTHPSGNTRNQRQRPLTPDEIRVSAAAWRLSDALHGLRVEYIPVPQES
jgi:hypothetical protein